MAECLPRIKSALLKAMAIVLIALALEASVFNFHFWSTASLPAVDQDSLNQQATYETNGSETTITYNDLGNIFLSSLSFHIEQQGSLTSFVRIDVTDSGQTGMPYTLNTIEVGSYQKTVYVPIDVYGYAKSLTITAWAGVGSAPVISDIEFNTNIPFQISTIRVVACIALLSVLYLVRPRSVIWKASAIGNPIPRRALLVCVVLATTVLYPWGYDPNEEAWGTFRCGAFDEYAELAHSIVDRGEFNLAETPAEYLQNMDDLADGEDRLTGDSNIYDPTARDREQRESQSDIGYKLDAAYYDGNYYVYFGVVPCLIAYVPFYFFTGSDLSNSVALFPALIAFEVFSYVVILDIVKRSYKEASCGTVFVAFTGFLICSAVIYSATSPFFYNVPVMYALAFLVIGTHCMLMALSAKSIRHRNLLSMLGTLSLILTIGCRPQITVGAFIVGLWYLFQVVQSKQSIKSGILSTLPPIILVCGLLALYNLTRFGSITDFGANYNLTGNDMTLRGSNMMRALEGVYWYIFGQPSISLKFPYVEQSLPTTAYIGKSTTEPFMFSILAMAPFLVLLPGFIKKGIKSRSQKLALTGLAVLTIALVLFDVEGAGIICRYIQDFGYIPGLLFVICLLAYEKQYQSQSMIFSDGTLYWPTMLLLTMGFIATSLIWIATMTSHLSGSVGELGILPFTFDGIKQLVDFWGVRYSYA